MDDSQLAYAHYALTFPDLASLGASAERVLESSELRPIV
jgi:hypothetical protein